MNILLAYPEYPDTFWSFKYALKFISRKAVHPPLGLMTVASMLPKKWNKKLVDVNIEKLKDKDIAWADYVFISAMAVQKKSVQEIIKRCKGKTKIVAGGPLFTAAHEDFENIDHFILNEAEITLPKFIQDLKNGNTKKVYTSTEFPDIEQTPVPAFELAKMNKYATMNIQYSRGCPFNCDFCDITTLFGKKIRTKSKKQIVSELETLYSNGWRGDIFFVDDNFIGNSNKLKKEILPAIINWRNTHKNTFAFSTEASINLADDEELMKLMNQAGFTEVFIGIETPDEKSLVECNKFQNRNRSLIDSIKKIQEFGIEVQGGFIVGFDNDSHSTFKRQIEFIQKSGIVTAMVGMLTAPKNTQLYERLKKENRLLNRFSGDNTDFSTNFIPKMGYDKLVKGYKKILKEIYSVKPYYARITRLLKNMKKTKRQRSDFQLRHVSAFIRSIFILGIQDKGRLQYWKLFFWSLFRCPKLFPRAITLAIYGYHFRTIFSECL